MNRHETHYSANLHSDQGEGDKRPGKAGVCGADKAKSQYCGDKLEQNRNYYNYFSEHAETTPSTAKTGRTSPLNPSSGVYNQSSMGWNS
jgi:hypothetical protein